MAIRIDRAPRLSPLGAVTLLTFALAACSQQAPPTTAAEAAQPASEPAAATPKRQLPKGFDFPPAPADGKWLVDDQGRRYYEHEVVKIDGTYTRMGDGKAVKFWWTPPFELLRETDTSFFVKIYSTEGAQAPDQAVAKVEPPPPPSEPKSAVTGGGDRLSFVRWSQGLPTHGQWRQGFDVADVDGDGHLDIVHGPPRKGGTAPAIFLGDGKGSWRRWTDVRLPDVPLDYGDAAAADFNGDGLIDLAFASHLKGIVVVVADGNGGYRRWSEGVHFETKAEAAPVTEPFTSRAIEVVDVDVDGRPDLLALGEGPTLRAERQNATGFSRGSRGTIAYLNQGDGTWKRQDVGGTSFGDALLVADLNGDQRFDVAAATNTHGDKGLLTVSRHEGGWEAAAIAALPSSAVFRAVAAADFDRDGRQDLAVGYALLEEGEWYSGASVLLARPEGRWEPRTLAERDDNVGIWSVAAGDLDGNGAADLVALTGDGATWVFLGDGKGSFTRDESPELATKESEGCTGYHAALEDLDGDGAAELLTAFAGEGGNYFGGDMIEKCTAGGSLQVWKAAPRSDQRAAKRRP